jgi:hypothetical protein
MSNIITAKSARTEATAAPRTKTLPFPFPTIAKMTLPSRVHQNTRQESATCPVASPCRACFHRCKAKPVGTAKLATNKELVLHLVRQSGSGESSEDRSARFQPTKIKVSGMRKRKAATKYMPATRIRLCAYSAQVKGAGPQRNRSGGGSSRDSAQTVAAPRFYLTIPSLSASAILRQLTLKSLALRC